MRVRPQEMIDEVMRLRNSGMTQDRVLQELQQKFGDKAPGDIRTIRRYEREAEKQKQPKQDVLTKRPKPNQPIPELQTVNQGNYQYGLPSVRDLVSQGISEDKAPWLLAQIDIAHRNNDQKQIRITEHLREIIAKVPDIPYDNALAGAELYAIAEDWNDPGTLEFVDMALRYQPWDSETHFRAFESVMFPGHKRSIEKRSIKVGRTWNGKKWSGRTSIVAQVKQVSKGEWNATAPGYPKCKGVGNSEKEALKSLREQMQSNIIEIAGELNKVMKGVQNAR